jgi:hypothetical protein
VVSRGGMSAVGTAVAADAPPASDKETPTTLSTGTASFRHLRFEACFLCAIAESPTRNSKNGPPRGIIGTRCIVALQGDYARSCLRRLTALLRKGCTGLLVAGERDFICCARSKPCGTQDHRTLLGKRLPRAFVKGYQARGPARSVQHVRSLKACAATRGWRAGMPIDFAEAKEFYPRFNGDLRFTRMTPFCPGLYRDGSQK